MDVPIVTPVDQVETRCAACGQANPPGSRFCNGCGQSFTPRGSSNERTPDSYTPKHLAERILTSKAALEGERKQVTVLFADLKGSMELLADRDPEEARKILDPVLELMMEAVHRYEGTVNQVMGDGIMALFGAPLAHEDHAVRACYAALRMQGSVKQYAEDIHRTEGVPIQIRVGLNSGEVVVRSIGNDLHMDYTAVGQTTHVASRMEQMAVPGSVLISSRTLDLAEGYVTVRPLGPRPVKGLEAPVEVYEVVGAGIVRSRFHAVAARGLTRFVGRDAELDQLRGALEQARRGHGQVVAVVGEPGVGKSRLFWEFAHSHHAKGCRILEAATVSYGKATTYFPIIELLKSYFRLEDRDDARTVREKVTGKVMTLERALEPALPALLTLLDVPVEDEQWTHLDPPQRRQRTLEAVKRLLLRESWVEPLIVIFEDLHWIDGETQAVLDGLVEGLPTARMLLLINYRPEYQHPWGSKTYYSHLRINPLPAEGAEELLRGLLGEEPTLQPLKRLLVEQTEGNPFFLEESVRTLVETRALVGERGAYRFARDVTTIQVPTTVQSVLAARIDRLGAQEKSLLQSASVVGKDVPFAILHAIADVPEEELGRSLANLQATEFLYETSLFPDLKYTFKHALTHDVTYGSLLQTRRCALHARILEAIEQIYADRLTEQLDDLAHHALRGEVWAKALRYLSQAGAKAAGRSANHEAVAYFEKALIALQHLPANRELLQQGIDLRLSLRNALLQLGEPGRILDHLRAAEELARTAEDDRALGRVVASMAHYFWLMGEYVQALESGRRALAIATDLGDFPLEITTSYYQGLACHSLGQYRRGAEILRGNVQSLQASLLHESFGTAGFHSVFARAWLVSCLAELGEFAEAVARGDEAVQIAEANDEPFSLIQAYLGVGGLHLRTGDLDRGIPRLERALDLCRVAHIRVLIPRVAASLGYMYTVSGRIAEALPVLEKAVEQAFAMPVIFMHATALAWLGEAYLRAGRLDEAMNRAQSALEHARRHDERGNEAWTLRLIADIVGSHEPIEVEKADDLYRQAIVLAEELGMRPLLAHCRLGLARLSARTGKAQEGKERLATATALFRELEMRFWLEKTEAEQAQIP